MKIFARCFFTVLVLMVFSISAQAQRLEKMISPISNFVNFEDPRPISELRFHYARHAFQDDFVTAGGNVQVYALQARYAVDDRLAIIATKDGIVDFNPDATLPKDEGLANLEAGVKYAVLKDDAAGNIVSVAMRYEAPTGDEEVLQGTGDGMLHPSVSGAWALTDYSTFMASSDMRIAIDSDDSSFWEFDFHLDTRTETKAGDFYPLLELNVIQVIDAGDRLPIPDEGVEVFNLGASDADGKTIVTGTAGLRWRACEAFDLGAGYQFPLTDGAGTRAVDWRLYTDAIWRF